MAEHDGRNEYLPLLRSRSDNEAYHHHQLLTDNDQSQELQDTEQELEQNYKSHFEDGMMSF